MSVSSSEALLRLGRWPNALIAAAGVLVGAWWARGSDADWIRVALALVSAIFLAFASYAWNDAADAEIDRVVHPERPIPRGELTPRDAARFAAFAALIGIASSALARPVLGLLAAASALLMRAYSASLKRHGAPGNLVVALLASLPFLWGAWAAGAPREGLWLVLVAAPLHLAREIAKDLDDAGGDVGRRRTIPLAFGAPAARAALLAALLLFVALLLPLAVRVPLFAAAVAPAILLAALAARHSWRGDRGAPALFKAAMLCAMAALLISRA
jgi:geranylgeranylglycerol-phosphate geranylgeranyltransferase